MKPDGSLPLPAEIVASCWTPSPAERVFAKIKDGRVTMMSGDAAHEEARAIVRKYIPADVDLAGSLIADRVRKRRGKMLVIEFVLRLLRHPGRPASANPAPTSSRLRGRGHAFPR